MPNWHLLVGFNNDNGRIKCTIIFNMDNKTLSLKCERSFS